MNWLDRQARRAWFSAGRYLTCGSIELVSPDRSDIVGRPGEAPAALFMVNHPRVFRRVLLGGDLAFGETYVDGDWTSPDLVTLVRFVVRNMPAIQKLNGAISWLGRVRSKLRHRLRSNTVDQSRDNIAAHYDLGNEFFALFLDRELAYSAAWYERHDDSLERAQIQKFDRICRKLQLTAADHVLEIGTGWGGFAAYAATRYGCRVTTTTISREQYAYAAERFNALGGEAGRRITLLCDDYRQLQGQFDKIVSIEMFEAVGFDHYDAFFATLDRVLAPAGAALLQTITMNEQDFSTYRQVADWMQTYVFPGSELASLSEMLRSMGRVTSLRAFDVEDLGAHYALTLHEWRARFNVRLDDVRRLGMDERFIRTWDLYLAYCEAAFMERYISDIQILFIRGGQESAYGGTPRHRQHDEAMSAVEVGSRPTPRW